MAVTAIAGAVQADRNAKKQRRAYRKAAAIEQKEIHRQKSIEADTKAKAARQARARMKARAAGAGVSGLTVDSLVNNVDMQMGTDLATIDGNRQAQVRGSDTALQSRLNSVQGADWIGTGLQIAGGVANQYNNTPPGGT